MTPQSTHRSLQNATSLKKQMWRTRILAAREHPRGVKGYCEQEGYSPQVLYDWRNRIKKDDPSFDNAPTKFRPGNALVPVRVVETNSSPKSKRGRTAKLSPAPAPNKIENIIKSAIQVRSADGTTVGLAPGSDFATLQLVLRAMRESNA